MDERRFFFLFLSGNPWLTLVQLVATIPGTSPLKWPQNLTRRHLSFFGKKQLLATNLNDGGAANKRISRRVKHHLADVTKRVAVKSGISFHFHC